MKSYVTIVLVVAFVSACGSKEPSSSNAQPAGSIQSASKIEGSQSPVSQTTSGAPVEFFYGGMTPDKTSISYKIKVNTDKPIEEVHLALKETDAGER